MGIQFLYLTISNINETRDEGPVFWIDLRYTNQ